MLFWLCSFVVSVALAYACWSFFSSSTASRCSFLKSILEPHHHRGGEQEEEEEKLSSSSKDKKGSHNKHRHHHSQKKYNPSATLEQEGGGSKSIHGASASTTSASTTSASKHHPLHGDVLKGVSKFCTAAAITPDGAVAAIAGSDMTLHLFDLSGGLLKSPSSSSSSPSSSSSSQQAVVHQPSRPHIVSRVQGESLSAIDFIGGDSSSSSSSIKIAGALENYRRLVIFELKKTDGDRKKSLVEVYRGEVALQKNRVRWLVASKGASCQWICTASEEDDTEIHVWSLSGGECLASVDTRQVQVLHFSSSPRDTRFVGCAAWSPGVKLYEIKNKNGVFAKMEKAMDLRTSKGTKCLAISSDNRRCVTLDKSGLLTLWNIDVRYFVSEDPKPLFSVEKALEASLSSSSGKRTSQSTSEEMKDEEEDPVVTQAFQNHVSQLAFSPDGKILICVAGCHIKFLQIEENEKKIFPIALIRFAHQRSIDTLLVPQQISSSPFILTAALDSRPQLWHLPDLSGASSS